MTAVGPSKITILLILILSQTGKRCAAQQAAAVYSYYCCCCSSPFQHVFVYWRVISYYYDPALIFVSIPITFPLTHSLYQSMCSASSAPPPRRYLVIPVSAGCEVRTTQSIPFTTILTSHPLVCLEAFITYVRVCALPPFFHGLLTFPIIGAHLQSTVQH